MHNDSTLTAEKSWKTVVNQLRMQLDKQTHTTLMGKTDFSRYEDGTFYISVQNSFTRDWLEQRMTETVVRMLSGVMGSAQKVQFILPSQSDSQTVEEELPVVEPLEKPTPQVKIQRSELDSFSLNPKYTFENFIVGPSNNLAHAACKAVAAMPGSSYNPLFVYSGVGLGKTHLLHAIGNEIVREKGLNVLYVTSEIFTNDFIDSIQRHENTAFREKYRTADVLLIDDIQFIIGKESTQEEFFHTFNTLYQMDKQIVISSDRPPKSMSTLDERMRSRFEWGLQVDIQAPDLETRIAILKSKAVKLKLSLTQEIQEIVARQVSCNIRELEGALNRLAAMSNLCQLPIDRNLVVMALGDILQQPSANSISDVIQGVAEAFELNLDEVLSRSRNKNILLCRQTAMHLLRSEEDLTLLQIGDYLGGWDHSTVLHACEKVDQLLKQNPSFFSKYSQIRQQIYGTCALA
ncbi:MAG: chromosomal replication initiator protein DnaA [Chloroflexi bacterium]|nr:chromosomal replication initiator protein DnaA [Chloroflexota bacterium]